MLFFSIKKKIMISPKNNCSFQCPQKKLSLWERTSLTLLTGINDGTLISLEPGCSSLAKLYQFVPQNHLQCFQRDTKLQIHQSQLKGQVTGWETLGWMFLFVCQTNYLSQNFLSHFKHLSFPLSTQMNFQPSFVNVFFIDDGRNLLISTYSN